MLFLFRKKRLSSEEPVQCPHHYQQQNYYRNNNYLEYQPDKPKNKRSKPELVNNQPAQNQLSNYSNVSIERIILTLITKY